MTQTAAVAARESDRTKTTGRFGFTNRTDPGPVELDYEACPACGQPSDYCQGHGEIGDPAGYAILVAHDDEDHTMCVADCHTDEASAA